MTKHVSFSEAHPSEATATRLVVPIEVYEAAGIGVILLNDEWRITTISPSLSTVFDVPTHDLQGRAFADLIADEQIERWQALMSNMEETQQIDIVMRANGSNWRWMQVTVGRTDDGYTCLLQDITRFKKAEDQREAEHALLNTIIDNLPDAIHAVDREGRYIFSNPAHTRLIGYEDADDVIGKPVSDLLPTEFATRFHEEDQHLLDGKTSHIDDELYGEIDGKEVWMTSNKLPLRGIDGEIIGVIGVSRDISAQRTSQKQLAKNEARHRVLLEAMPEMMLATRQDGVITAYHGGEEATVIAGDQNIMGQPLTATDLPESLVSEVLYYMPLTLRSGTMQSFEFKVQQSDDETQREFFEARMVALNADEVLTLIRNITPLKRIQEELSHHIEDLDIVRQMNAELSADLNFNYVVQLAMDSTMRLSGAQSGFMVMVEADGSPRLVGMVGNYDEAYIKELLQNKKGIVPRVLQSQEPKLIFDVKQEADYVPMLDDTEAMMVIPLISTERLVGVMVLETRRAQRFTRDRFHFLQLITGRIAAFLDNANLYRQTQEQLVELRSLYEEVRHLEQLKTDMIRIASHDLKNPLAGVMGYLEMLRMDINDQLTDMQRNYMTQIETAARKMQRITTSILSLERIKQLSEQQIRESVDLAELVRGSISEQMDWIVRKAQVLVRELPDEQVIVGADPIQLHEAISNLINNAIKYTPEEGTITVSVKVVDQMAQMRVQDTGYGIPTDQQDRLFSPFFRANSRETRNIEGTGLGLHLVQNIIERHNGTMFFESTYGEGSTFGFDLPLKPKRKTEDTLPSRPF